MPVTGAAPGPGRAASDGKALTAADLQHESTLVGFFTSGCKPCAALRGELARNPPGIPFIAFVEGESDDPEVAEMVQALSRLGSVARMHTGDGVTRAFQPSGFPTLIRTEHGKIAAAGHRLRQVM